MKWLPVALLIASVLSGCTDSSSDEADPIEAAPPETAVALPEPIAVEEDIFVEQDVGNLLGLLPPCANPTSACRFYEFVIPEADNATITMTADLAWGVPTNDFDMYLRQNGELIATDGRAPPATEEQIVMSLAAGTYELIIASWAVVMDTFTLDATFELVEETGWDDEE